MKKVISIGVILCMLVPTIITGCDGSKVSKKGGAASNIVTSNLSVQDIKEKYKSETDTAVMPMYNVDYNKEFNFDFNSNLGDLGSSDIISVHTDIKCLPESKVMTFTWLSLKDGKTSISIKPSAGVMPLTSKADDNKTGGYWGGAPAYYIRIAYDVNSKEIKKLDKPIVIPFTVKSDLPVPNLREEISSDGRLKLVWDKVEGAEKYNIYNATHMSLDSDNKPLRGAEDGYLGVMASIQATVTATEWDDFDGNGKHGIIMIGTDYLAFQNGGVEGEYFVTAVAGEKESHLSVPVNTPLLSAELPYKFADGLNLDKYESVADLPQTAKVEFINDSTSQRNIIYDTSNVKINVDYYTDLKYTLEGTALSGLIKVKMTEKDIATINSNKPKDSNNGTVKPKNSTDKVPNPNVPTVIDPDKKTPAKTDTKSDDTVKAMEDNTKKQVEDGDKQKVEAPVVSKDIPVSASSAAEEYLALQLIGVNQSISLKSFPELQNSEALNDTFLKVLYQNSMILGVKTFAYNYSTLTLKIEYNESPDATKKKQQAIVVEAKKIVAANIKADMTVEQKRKVLYDYLNANTKYDKEALKDAEASGFKKVDAKYDDSFTTYGIMVKKVGVCASYAASYKLLCELAGVECIVVTGTIQNVPHAWNKVKIDNEWLNVDNTNNLTNSGIAYFCYDTNDDTATKLSYIESKEFCVDTDFTKYKGMSNKNDYYVLQGLEVKDITAYSDKLTELLGKGDTNIVIRSNALIDKKTISSATAEVINKVAKNKLGSAKMSILGTYINIEAK